MFIGNRIKDARNLAKLTQMELAEKIGVSDKTISAYENNRAVPPIYMIAKIAKATNRPILFFIPENLQRLNV